MHSKGKFGQIHASSTTGGADTGIGGGATGEFKKKKSGAISIIPMLDKFHDIIGGIHVPVDDGVDKLNRKYTLLVFLFLALPIFTKQYIGEPIECFAPVYFAEHQSRYINSYCWTQSTYYMVPVGDPEDDGDQQEPPDRIMPDEVDYFIGFETVTHIGNERLRRVRVNYYQWAPLILLAQGLCFYIPFLIWNSCANNAGVKLRRLLKKASDIASLPPGCQQREALLAEFVDQFHTLVTGEAGWCADLQCGTGGSGGGSNSSSLISGSSNGSGSGPPQTSQPAGRGGGGAHGRGGGTANHHSNQAANHNDDTATRGDHHSRHHGGGNPGCCLVSIPIIGNLLACCLRPCASFGMVGPSKYLCLLYLAVKTAYVLNVGLQFFLLGQFLGRGYLKHGIELLNRLIINGEWWASPRFPLSTLCQVRADMSGGLRSYTCQCVLPINVFNEKIFSVVWFYMAFLLPLNVLSLLFWIYRTFETNRLSYIRLCLWRTRLVELNQIHRTVRRLSQSYLGWDGVFLLRLIEHNHGSIMATLIMSRLWEFYANQMKLQEDANQLALANNAQHTLAQTTTAISNQHQIMMAAAAAAAQQPQGQQQQQVSHQGQHAGHAHHQQPHHGYAGNHGGHAHGPQPLMPGGPNSQQQQQHQGAGHSHGPIHPAAAFAAGAGHGQPLAPMVPHGPHGHHAGQISQPGGHHPLHAANTHAHHPPPPHLNAFANATNASLLAQLQHQHHQQQQQQQQHHQHQTGGGQLTNSSASNQQQQQQSAPGNVAAAVAALAAAAAANHSSSASAAAAAAVAAATGNANPNSATASGNSKATPLLKGSQVPAIQQQGSGANNQSGTNHQVSSSSNTNNINSNASAAAANKQQQVAAAASSATTSFITAPGSQTSGGPPLPPPPPAHVVAAVAAAAGVAGPQQTIMGAAPGSASVRPGGNGLANQQQQQQQVAGRPMQPQQATNNTNNANTNNPALNLRSSNIQVAAAQAAAAAAANGASKFSPHTIKRTT